MPKRKADELGAKWTEVEQKRLEDLVNTGSFNLSDPTIALKDLDETFDKFSNNVIGYYVGQMKKKSSRQDSAGPVKQVGPVKQILSQLGIVPTSSNIVPPSIYVAEVSSCELNSENMPFMRYCYMGYNSKQEKIVVLVDLPGGTTSYKWEFNDLGDRIVVTAEWSTSLYDVAKLFHDELKLKKVTMNHPKLHAMQNEIVRRGMSQNNIPNCRVHIPLGKRVQKDDGTWNVSMVRHDGNKIISFEFSGFQEETLKQQKRGSF